MPAVKPGYVIRGEASGEMYALGKTGILSLATGEWFPGADLSRFIDCSCFSVVTVG